MSENRVHLYRAESQPAHHFFDYNFDPPMEFKWPKRKLLWCDACGKRRIAENCTVQVYYDAIYVWCADGKGCKSEKEITAKRRREFRNRSRAQKRRWAKAKGKTA